MPKSDPVPSKRIANAHAWTRYWRIMRWMTVLAFACIGAALVYFHLGGNVVPVHMMIAASLGIFLTVMVGTGLMLLAFLSHGSGHDDAAADPFADRPPN